MKRLGRVSEKTRGPEVPGMVEDLITRPKGSEFPDAG